MPVVIIAGVELAAPIVAVAVSLIIYATFYVFAKPIATLLSGLPVVGSYVASTVYNATGALVDWALGWADSVLTALIEVISAPIIQAVNWASAVTAELEVLPGTIDNIASQLWSAVTSAAGDAATALANAAAAGAAAAAALASAKAIGDALVYVRDTLIPAEFKAWGDQVAQWIASAVAAVDAAWRIAANELGQAIDGVRNELGALGQAIEGTIDTVILPRLASIEGTLAGLVPAVTALVSANLISRLLTLETTVETTIEECVAPTCSVVKPQLDWLNALMDGGLLLAVGALVGDAVADPEGAAKVTAELVGGMVGDATSLIDAFAGTHL